MKSLKLLVLFASLAFIFAGCASTAHIEKDDTVNFKQYKTYAWVDDSNDKTSRNLNGIQKDKLRTAVDAELSKVGWQEVKKKQQPDVLLKHDILIERTRKEGSSPMYSQGFTRPYFNPWTRRFNYVYYPSQFVGYRDDSYMAKEGTLTITMIDAQTDKTVWQGWTTDEIDSRNISSKELQSSVKSIFKKFDVASN